jgi:hypothetical protein
VRIRIVDSFDPPRLSLTVLTLSLSASTVGIEYRPLCDRYFHRLTVAVTFDNRCVYSRRNNETDRFDLAERHADSATLRVADRTRQVKTPQEASQFRVANKNDKNPSPPRHTVGGLTSYRSRSPRDETRNPLTGFASRSCRYKNPRTRQRIHNQDSRLAFGSPTNAHAVPPRKQDSLLRIFLAPHRKFCVFLRNRTLFPLVLTFTTPGLLTRASTKSIVL